jgi:hypothetical protein
MRSVQRPPWVLTCLEVVTHIKIEPAEQGDAMPDDQDQPPSDTPPTDTPPAPTVPAPEDDSWIVMDIIEHSDSHPGQERRDNG